MSSQALLVKIVTKILCGQCTFSKSRQTTVLAARPRHMYAQERTKPQGQKVGKGVAPWRPWWVRHCRTRIIQASTWTASCKYHWEYFVRGGLIRTTTFKQQDNNAVGRSTLPELWETLTHQSHRVHKQTKKESKTIGPRVQTSFSVYSFDTKTSDFDSSQLASLCCD